MPILLRRRFLVGMTLVPALARGEEQEEVSPAEDLMREHGVLKRALLVYNEAVSRLERKQELPPAVIPDTAQLIRKFVEEYHEKLEEDYLFPRFRKANKLVDLVNTLKAQHDAGRRLTARIIANARDASKRDQVIQDMRMFVRMYEPHEAWEDTVLFPAFRKLVSKHEYDALGEDFEKKENQEFGGDGFEKNVAEIARIEKTIGIYDLGQFTPRV